MLTYADYYLPTYDYNEESDCYEDVSNPIHLQKFFPMVKLLVKNIKGICLAIPRSELEEYIKDEASAEVS